MEKLPALPVDQCFMTSWTASSGEQRFLISGKIIIGFGIFAPTMRLKLFADQK